MVSYSGRSLMLMFCIMTSDTSNVPRGVPREGDSRVSGVPLFFSFSNVK